MAWDYDVVATWVCSTNMDWETTVKGSKGAEYTVRWGRLFGQDYVVQECQYGWTCTCPAFTKSRNSHLPCKHIKAVEASGARCGWNGTLEPTATCEHDVNGEPCCPDCDGPLDAIRVAV